LSSRLFTVRVREWLRPRKTEVSVVGGAGAVGGGGGGGRGEEGGEELSKELSISISTGQHLEHSLRCNGATGRMMGETGITGRIKAARGCGGRRANARECRAVLRDLRQSMGFLIEAMCL
jgi:hypothetical protein